MMLLPQQYESPLHLPFNRACLDEQFELQAPGDDSGGEGYGLLLRGNKLLLAATEQGVRLPLGEWPKQNALHLGSWQGRPCRLIELTVEDKVPTGLQAFSLINDEPHLPIDILSLGGMARMILHWVKNSRFCGCCGRSMTWLPSEWGRYCPECKAHYYPAIYPCAIVLVRRPGEVLLVRKPIWAPNRYSLVAGFQEFGESLEETAVREIKEETGVRVHNLRYVGSQCWPFPSQLMAGFVADYLGGEVEVETAELEDARWFRVDDLPSLPPKRSIARYILDTALDLDKNKGLG